MSTCAIPSWALFDKSVHAEALISENEVVAFSDMLGSGQQHLVRIRRDSVQCWPNLGRGRFGAPITLARNWFKEEVFNAHCVFLSDLDGSGATDLIYVQSDRLLIWRNQSGNGFSPSLVLPFPKGVRYDKLCHLSFADIHGLGCASLVLTVPHPEPQHWCYDFSQGCKPYLLTSINNNMGLQVDLAYRSSAQEWLDEKAEHEKAHVPSSEPGAQPPPPAVSHLPFPVHVLRQMIYLDEITQNILVQQFSYRHGYYDGKEREFRGFGLVIHTDSEEFSNSEDETYTDPVTTKTWYHTGAPQADTARAGYSQHDAKAISLKPTVFTSIDAKTKQQALLTTENGLSAEMRTELLRALKGSVLREEVFGLNVSEAEPYTTSESRYIVRLMQGGGADKRAVVLPLPLETTSYHYERTPTDPVCTRQINLEWDEYGMLLRHVNAQYPRRKDAKRPDNELQAQWWEASKDPSQEVLWLTQTRQSWYHLEQSHAWHLGLPHQSRQDAYEIKDASEEIPDLSYEGLHRFLDDRKDLSVLLGQQQTFYVEEAEKPGRPTLAGLVTHIELAELDTNSLQVYKGLEAPTGPCLSLSGLVEHGELTGHDASSLQADEKADEVLSKALVAAGYELKPPILPRDGEAPLWWVRRDLCTSAPENIFQRLTHYAPSPGISQIRMEYDHYMCQLIALEDAQGLCTKAAYDYRHLQPISIQDPNNNIQEARYDSLGRLIATSFYSVTEEGERSEGFDRLPVNYCPPITSLDEALADPERAIGRFAAVYYYDALRWMQKRGTSVLDPARSAALISDNYPDDAPKAQVRISLAWSDGFERILQTKQKAPPGKAYQRDEEGNLKIEGTKLLEVDTREAARWVVSGRVEYNNKGLPVRTYQPYFVDSSSYVNDAALRKFGYYDTHYYDPLGREVRTVTASKYLRRQTYCTWYEIKEDENDTLEEVLAARQSAA